MLRPCGERGISLTQEISKKDSIYLQLLRLLLAAAFVSVLLFLVVDTAGTCFLDRALTSSGYQAKQDARYAEGLQDYVEKEQLSFKDTSAITDWVTKQKIIAVDIYKDGNLVFSSLYPELVEVTGKDVSEQSTQQENRSAQSVEKMSDTLYTVRFADGNALVNVMGAYGYQAYNSIFIASLLLAFAVFLSLVLLGIRKKMKYIRTLSEEIEILEGGSLEYAITVKGKDELGALAAGLENMRLSFLTMREKEAEMVKENQRIVTEMSHDLRTPVTSILLYAEILKKSRNLDAAQQKRYMDIIEKKAQRMKQLADHLFTYSFEAGEEEISLEEPEEAEEIFYDLFSETCGYLEQKGFSVDFRVEWEKGRVQISGDYLIRIMDNITSNIIKYADAAFPVRISSAKTPIGFIFENHVRFLEEKTESTEIGIQNIKSMMEKMGGKCIEETTGQVFRLTLWFPVVSDD